jgi:sulfate adenylyltransferase
MGATNQPHGGTIMDLYLDEAAATAVKQQARDYPSWDLTARQLCDIEQLLNGGFSPLQGFLTRQAYTSVLTDMRLPNDLLWPIPVVLDVSQAFADTLEEGRSIALRDPEGVLIATLTVEDIWTPDKNAEAHAVYGTDDLQHAGVDFLFRNTHPVYIGGTLRGVEAPLHYDFTRLRATPTELRAHFAELGWGNVVAFHTDAPMHRAQQTLSLQAMGEYNASLLLHPVVGMSKPGNIGHYARVRCYQHILPHYPPQTTLLSLLNLALRSAGPRAALWHGIIRKNYGCTHFIVNRDHAAPQDRPDGQSFYQPYAAQEMFEQYRDELGITPVALPERLDSADQRQLSADELHRRLAENLEIPDGFSYPEILNELRKAHPPRQRQGFTVFFTGLSGSGKSTIANALLVKLMECGGRRVTLLDGDLVRKHLSSELSFSREHRDLNILRIGYVASEITANGGVAICAPIAPYAETRRRVREMITAVGGFIEVYVATALEICEQRDRKGLYARARAGLIKEFTGISDPYEAPQNAEIVIDTGQLDAGLAAQRIMLKLEDLGYLR